MITSVKNERVKEWKKLKQRKSRYQKMQFLIEGFHLLEEAWKSGWNIQEIIVKQGITIPDIYKTHPTTEVSDTVFEQITETESPQGVIAVVGMKKEQRTSGNRILMIDAVQDPGNLGTIIRTADAAGYSKIILGEGTVDVFNDKTVRATQGSIFHIPIISGNLPDCIQELKSEDFQIITSTLMNSAPYSTIDIPEKMALIVGNEGKGIDEHIITLADHNVHIPIYGRAESLNVSIAAGILMYHFK